MSSEAAGFLLAALVSGAIAIWLGRNVVRTAAELVKERALRRAAEEAQARNLAETTAELVKERALRRAAEEAQARLLEESLKRLSAVGQLALASSERALQTLAETTLRQLERLTNQTPTMPEPLGDELSEAEREAQRLGATPWDDLAEIRQQNITDDELRLARAKMEATLAGGDDGKERRASE